MVEKQGAGTARCNLIAFPAHALLSCNEHVTPKGEWGSGMKTAAHGRATHPYGDLPEALSAALARLPSQNYTCN